MIHFRCEYNVFKKLKDLYAGLLCAEVSNEFTRRRIMKGHIYTCRMSKLAYEAFFRILVLLPHTKRCETTTDICSLAFFLAIQLCLTIQWKKIQNSYQSFHNNKTMGDTLFCILFVLLLLLLFVSRILTNCIIALMKGPRTYFSLKRISIERFPDYSRISNRRRKQCGKRIPGSKLFTRNPESDRQYRIEVYNGSPLKRYCNLDTSATCPALPDKIDHSIYSLFFIFVV